MESHTFKTSGVCSREISFSVKDGRLYSVRFVAGCQGNLIALGRLVEGMPVEQVRQCLKGIHCGDKLTSCADQLCHAIELAR